MMNQSQAASTAVEVKFTSDGPVGFAPLFAAFHDGSYDVFDPGAAASSGLETLAEVGDPGGLIGGVPGGVNAVAVLGTAVPAAPVFPVGASDSTVVMVDSATPFFNYAAMVLPTNDWFVGNGVALNIGSILDQPVGTSLSIPVLTVWDAGTELEDFDFSAGNGLFGVGGAGDAPNGTAQGGVVSEVTGANPFGVFANGDGAFDRTTLDFSGAQIATIDLTVVPTPAVPEPSTGLLLIASLGAFIFRRRR